MKLETVEEAFESFATAIFKNFTPSATQREETKRAFYAGYWCLLQKMNVIGQSPEVSEDEAISWLDQRHTEITEFYEEMLDRHAKRN